MDSSPTGVTQDLLQPGATLSEASRHRCRFPCRLRRAAKCAAVSTSSRECRSGVARVGEGRWMARLRFKGPGRFTDTDRTPRRARTSPHGRAGSRPVTGLFLRDQPHRRVRYRARRPGHGSPAGYVDERSGLHQDHPAGARDTVMSTACVAGCDTFFGRAAPPAFPHALQCAVVLDLADQVQGFPGQSQCLLEVSRECLLAGCVGLCPSGVPGRGRQYNHP